MVLVISLFFVTTALAAQQPNLSRRAEADPQADLGEVDPTAAVIDLNGGITTIEEVVDFGELCDVGEHNLQHEYLVSIGEMPVNRCVVKCPVNGKRKTQGNFIGDCKCNIGFTNGQQGYPYFVGPVPIQTNGAWENVCVSNCDEGQAWRGGKTGVCEDLPKICAAGEIWNKKKLKCITPKAELNSMRAQLKALRADCAASGLKYFGNVDDGSCCEPSRRWDSKTQSCQCKFGQVEISYTDFKNYNEAITKCSCDHANGMKMLNGRCRLVTCPITDPETNNGFWNPSKCEATQPETDDQDPICKCPSEGWVPVACSTETTGDTYSEFWSCAKVGTGSPECGDFKEVKYEDWADDCSNTGLEGQR